MLLPYKLNAIFRDSNIVGTIVFKKLCVIKNNLTAAF